MFDVAAWFLCGMATDVAHDFRHMLVILLIGFVSLPAQNPDDLQTGLMADGFVIPVLLEAYLLRLVRFQPGFELRGRHVYQRLEFGDDFIGFFAHDRLPFFFPPAFLSASGL